MCFVYHLVSSEKKDGIMKKHLELILFINVCSFTVLIESYTDIFSAWMDLLFLNTLSFHDYNCSTFDPLRLIVFHLFLLLMMRYSQKELMDCTGLELYRCDIKNYLNRRYQKLFQNIICSIGIVFVTLLLCFIVLRGCWIGFSELIKFISYLIKLSCLLFLLGEMMINLSLGNFSSSEWIVVIVKFAIVLFDQIMHTNIAAYSGFVVKEIKMVLLLTISIAGVKKLTEGIVEKGKDMQI